MRLPTFYEQNLIPNWGIEGDFLATNPSGASGGALPGGIGWYRKHFDINDYLSFSNELCYIF